MGGDLRGDPGDDVRITQFAGGAAEVVSGELSPESDPSPDVSGRPSAKPSGTTSPVPIADATGREAVDGVLATTSAAVDDVGAAVPAPVVPPDTTSDAVDAVDALAEGDVPDPPPVVQDVQDVTSPAVSDALL